ncbi:kinase-like domain-containing protein [Mycena galericulata]|nr:kinase-like domain-containing protein [Mycena galericulata]
MPPADSESVDASYSLGRLGEGEIFWRDHQRWLHECGYMLRSRYRPGWIPSWQTDPTKEYILCEDGIPLSFGPVIDAIRIKDGVPFTLKVVSKTVHPNEAEVFGYFSSRELASDPRNHCLPFLSQLSPPDDEDKLIFVMKSMQRYDNPRFDTFGEVVELFRQMFEGLQFMHHHRVAHRDCNFLNIMMDGGHLFPNGFHPQRPSLTPDLSAKAKHYTRTQRPVKYYFIDFGISSKFEPGEDTRVDVIIGGDRTVPEFLSAIAKDEFERLDPFPTDIYYLGNMIRMEFLDGVERWMKSPKLGFEFMRPLVSDMVQADPTKRPNIDEVVSRFETIRNGLSSWKLRSRVVKKTESPFHLVRITKHWIRRVGYVWMRVPAIPTPKP